MGTLSLLWLRDGEAVQDHFGLLDGRGGGQGSRRLVVLRVVVVPLLLIAVGGTVKRHLETWMGIYAVNFGLLDLSFTWYVVSLWSSKASVWLDGIFSKDILTDILCEMSDLDDTGHNSPTKPHIKLMT